MKKNYIVLLMVAFFATKSKGQAVLDTLTFEPLLSQVDTFWNGSDMSGGFTESPSQWRLFFENNYNATWSSWEGFAYSSMRDDTSRGYTNQYSCIAGKGVDSSDVYVVGFQGYLGLPTIQSVFPVANRAVGGDSLYGVYVNNSTYAYYSMLEGDLVGKKFGDTIGPGDTVADGTNGEDWFMLTIFDGNNDSVDFYLADYRFANDSLDYIIKDWTWVDLSSLDISFGLQFKLRSSDNDPLYGMNTPAYFCLDNLIARLDMTSSIDELNQIEVNVYPNPTADYITINADIEGSYNLELYNSNGQLVSKLNNLYQNNKIVSLIDMPKGNYMLRLISDKGIASKQIIKL